MTHEEKIKQAKQYLSDEGYGTGSNFGLLTVASFTNKFGNSNNSKTESVIPHVVKSVCEHKYGSRIVFGERRCAKCGVLYGGI